MTKEQILNEQREHDICERFITEVLANTSKVRNTVSIMLFAFDEYNTDDQDLYRPYWLGSFMGSNHITRYFYYDVMAKQFEEITKMDFYHIANDYDADINQPDYTENC